MNDRFNNGYGGQYSNNPNNSYGGYNGNPNGSYGGYNNGAQNGGYYDSYSNTDPNGFYGGYDSNNPDSYYNGNTNQQQFSGYSGNPGFTGDYGANMNYTNAAYANGMASGVSLAEFTRKVYGWMFVGLMITFGMGMLVLLNPIASLEFLVAHYGLFWIVAIIELVLVFALSHFIDKMSPTVATVIFLLYSVACGLTIAPVLLVNSLSVSATKGGLIVDPSGPFMAFAATALLFGGMSVYGMVTKRDLSKWTSVLLFGLLGLIGYSLIALIFQVPMSDLFIGIIGVILFTAFTAYDTQKIKRRYYALESNGEMLQKGAIFSALELYLDFINLFLYLLRLFASKRR